MTATWLETRHVVSSRVRVDEETRSLRLAGEHARLTQDHTRLHSQYHDLVASAEMWIRLYEAALERANAAAAECSRLRQPAAQRGWSTCGLRCR
jgi:hypothetical protein